MKPLKFFSLDCQTFADALKNKINLVFLEDLSGKIPHVGYGGAGKSKYISPKSGKEIFVLEVNGWYDADAYINDVWQFEKDFTAEEATEFLKKWKKLYPANPDNMDEFEDF
jgi:hypothetical protein